jgi:Aminotransferase class-III
MLGSQQDSNFLLVADGGTVAGVLKVANPAFTAAEIEAQDAAADVIAAGGELRAGTPRHGPASVLVDGVSSQARVLTYLPGAAVLGAHGGRAELLPRPSPRSAGRPVCRRRGAGHRRARGRRPPAGRVPGRAVLRQRRRDAAPDGYLAAVYAEVRRHGGLAIADEIQVGYGRLGRWFWGFEQQGVVPDVVTVAKAMGNGYPLGAVVTSREIAGRYRDAGYFFSSTGGSPVSSVIGLTVLDVIADEDLQANAARVGGHLKARLEELAARHELIGAVHGSGLYLGVEFVRDRGTLEPATEETMAICDRMLELGVIIQPTSDRMCVLKIKPPLCLDIAGADYFADALDRVLTEGW